MFSQKQNYFTRLTKTYPLLKHIDIYDRQAFIREYVLDNVYVCIFMYFLFYIAIWFANKAIKRIEKANKELMKTVVSNRTKLDDVMALKDKRAEYEDIVVKAKSAQRVTAKHLDNEMKRLSTELVATGNKMAELEKILGKMLFSASSGKNLEIVAKEFIDEGKAMEIRRQRLSRTRSRMSRSSNRHFRQRYRRPASTASLSRDQQVTNRQQSPEIQRRKSDSSNRASAETSSNDSRHMSLSRIISRYQFQYEAENKRRRSKKRSRRSSSITKKVSSTSLTKSSLEPHKVTTPFTKSVLDVGSILLDDY